MELFTVDTLEQAREKLRSCSQHLPLCTQSVTLDAALRRVVAADILAPEDIPGFYRSTVDGYAVVAADTQAAGESIPVFLSVTEEVAIGRPARGMVTPGTCAYVPTGGMLPPGANAVVMVEYTECFHENEIAVCRPAAEGSNVVIPGEETARGAVLLRRGALLDPAQIGALASAGVWSVPVYRPWRISIISTGDELVHPSRSVGPAQVRDVNTYVLESLAGMCGFEVVSRQTIPDREGLLERELNAAKGEADLVLVSGGSSQGKADYTCRLMERVCDRGVMTHGLAVKPGKPTILALDEASGTLMLGLPGHPVAAMMVFQALAVWLWKEVTGQTPQLPIPGELAVNLPGAPGKTTFVQVKLQRAGDGRQLAVPILSKSGLMGALVNADGYLVMERNREGLRKGEPVAVYRLGL